MAYCCKPLFSLSLGFKIRNVSLIEKSKVNLALPPLIKPSTFLVGLHFYVVFFSFKFSYKSKNLYSVAYSYFLNPLFSFSFGLKMRNVSLKEKRCQKLIRTNVKLLPMIDG